MTTVLSEGALVKREDEAPFSVNERFHVLLVEDDNVTLKTVEQVLKKCGYLVTTACNGQAALQFLQATKQPGGPRTIDLILTDILMPQISGFDLIKEVSKDDKYSETPVVVMSAQDSQSSVLQAFEFGAADYLIKPVRQNELATLWQHVWRANRHKHPGGSGSGAGSDQHAPHSQHNDSIQQGHQHHPGALAVGSAFPHHHKHVARDSINDNGNGSEGSGQVIPHSASGSGSGPGLGSIAPQQRQDLEGNATDGSTETGQSRKEGSSSPAPDAANNGTSDSRPAAVELTGQQQGANTQQDQHPGHAHVASQHRSRGKPAQCSSSSPYLLHSANGAHAVTSSSGQQCSHAPAGLAPARSSVPQQAQQRSLGPPAGLLSTGPFGRESEQQVATSSAPRSSSSGQTQMLAQPSSSNLLRAQPTRPHPEKSNPASSSSFGSQRSASLPMALQELAALGAARQEERASQQQPQQQQLQQLQQQQVQDSIVKAATVGVAGAPAVKATHGQQQQLPQACPESSTREGESLSRSNSILRHSDRSAFSAFTVFIPKKTVPHAGPDKLDVSTASALHQLPQLRPTQLMPGACEPAGILSAPALIPQLPMPPSLHAAQLPPAPPLHTDILLHQHPQHDGLPKLTHLHGLPPGMPLAPHQGMYLPQHVIQLLCALSAQRPMTKDLAPGGFMANGFAVTAFIKPTAAHRKAAVAKYLEKKKNRSFKKKVRYASRKRLAEARPRVRGQFVKQSDLAKAESEAADKKRGLEDAAEGGSAKRQQGSEDREDDDEDDVDEVTEGGETDGSTEDM